MLCCNILCQRTSKALLMLQCTILLKHLPRHSWCYVVNFQDTLDATVQHPFQVISKTLLMLLCSIRCILQRPCLISKRIANSLGNEVTFEERVRRKKHQSTITGWLTLWWRAFIVEWRVLASESYGKSINAFLSPNIKYINLVMPWEQFLRPWTPEKPTAEAHMEVWTFAEFCTCRHTWTYRIPFGTHMKTFFLSILPNCCYLFVFFILEFSDLSDFSILLLGDLFDS